MTYLLDTCILSKLRKLKKHPDPHLAEWIDHHDESVYFISVLTIGEIEQGISKLKSPADRRIFDDWLRGEVIPRFKGRIVSIDLKTATKWGELNGSYQRKGITIPVVDGLIAATAVAHDLTLVTENEKDFSPIEELRLFSPWEYHYL